MPATKAEMEAKKGLDELEIRAWRGIRSRLLNSDPPITLEELKEYVTDKDREIDYYLKRRGM